MDEVKAAEEPKQETRGQNGDMRYTLSKFKLSHSLGVFSFAAGLKVCRSRPSTPHISGGLRSPGALGILTCGIATQACGERGDRTLGRNLPTPLGW